MSKRKSIPLISLLLCSLIIQAQPFTLDKQFKAEKLLLRKFNIPSEPKAKGRISITKVTQLEDTLFYFVKDASIYSPVYVSLQTSDSSNNEPLQITLHKMSWRKAERKGTTDAKGYWHEIFKTENDFGIRVIAKNKPAVYSIMVWVGDEAKMEIPSAFKKGAPLKTGSNFFKDNLLYLILAVVAVMAALIFFKFKNKKNDNPV
ncbi:MAG: hypothetical protein SGI83_14290 [Bacteroidota bacterium]|nr:hypothetical protein [Bacteroidota bacterium]